MLMKQSERVAQIAAEAFAVLDTGRQVAPFSSRGGAFDLTDAYGVASLLRDMRKARGEHPVGRKIGFTNRAVWGGYGISGPIWNYMFDTTVMDLAAADGLFRLANLPEPRIEPEIVLHLASAPRGDMSERELFGCVDWIAHGFEIVHSIFPGWSFEAADAVAAYGVHSALLLGDKHSVREEPQAWEKALSSFTVELIRGDGLSRSGHAQNVLGGPLKALRFLVGELARFPGCEPLRAGELVTTGTLTEAMPALAGEAWSTRLNGIRVDGLHLRFA